MSLNTSAERIKARLAKLPFPTLRAEGRKYGIKLADENRDRWTDAIIDHIMRQEKLQPSQNPEQFETTMLEENSTHFDSAGNSKDNHSPSNLSLETDSQDPPSVNKLPHSYTTLKEQIEMQKEQMAQQSDILQQIVKQQSIMQQLFMSLSISKTSTSEQNQISVSTQHQLPSSAQNQTPISTQHQTPAFSQPQLPISTQHLETAHMQHQGSAATQHHVSLPATSLIDLHEAQDTHLEIPQVAGYTNLQMPVLSPQGMVPQRYQDTNNNLFPEMSFAAAAHSIKFLTNSISSFGGTEDEDISLWLEKIETIANNYNLSPMIRLSAATTKLNKAARRWMDLSPGNINKSWDTFKEAITRRFNKK